MLIPDFVVVDDYMKDAQVVIQMVMNGDTCHFAYRVRVFFEDGRYEVHEFAGPEEATDFVDKIRKVGGYKESIIEYKCVYERK